MNAVSARVIIFAGAFTVLACSDLPSAADHASTDLAVGFSSIPLGYTSAQTTYGESAEGTGAFMPHEHMGGMGHGPGPGMGGGMGAMIGGGLGPDFLGGPGLGFGFGPGHHNGDPALDSSTCTFNATAGRVECAPVTNDRGLTIARSVAYTDPTGATQTVFDAATTNTVNTRVQVSGTITRHDNAVSVIAHESNRTVAGLASGSTQHVINGTASGSENTTGTDSLGAFTAVRIAGDTISGVVIPVTTDTVDDHGHRGHAYPTAGTIIRAMQVTVTQAGAVTRSSSRREVITYDGTSTAHMVIAQNGTTKTCTLPLPFGRPTCQ